MNAARDPADSTSAPRPFLLLDGRPAPCELATFLCSCDRQSRLRNAQCCCISDGHERRGQVGELLFARAYTVLDPCLCHVMLFSRALCGIFVIVMVVGERLQSAISLASAFSNALATVLHAGTSDNHARSPVLRPRCAFAQKGELIWPMCSTPRLCLWPNLSYW